jgi:two-component system, OmpR family, response regulator
MARMALGHARELKPRTMSAEMRVLLIEDEERIADLVVAGLGARSMDVHVCNDGNAGFEQARRGAYDAVVLDLMLPGRDGLSVLAGLRAEGIATPVILLTARNELGDRIEGLNLGADDYLAKPFFVEELHARLLALMRRQSSARHNVLQVGGFQLDRIARQVEFEGRTIELTGREFSLVEYLMRSSGQLFTRTQILEHVWGYDFDPGTNLVDTCIKRIRKKIREVRGMDAATDTDGVIESVRGVGYRFRQPA